MKDKCGLDTEQLTMTSNFKKYELSLKRMFCK